MSELQNPSNPHEGRIVLGEYRVEHLRPIPEKLPEFLPLWEECLKAEAALADCVEKGLSAQADHWRAEEERLRKAMRPLQYVVGESVFPNLVTDLGARLTLDTILGNTAAGAVVMGLKGAGAAAVGDTQASHAGWLEQGGANAPTYSGTRKTPTFSAATGTGAGSRQKTTSSAVAFSITSSGTVAGCFINIGGTSAIDNTTGTLFSAGDFAASKTVANLDTLNVTYTLSC